MRNPSKESNFSQLLHEPGSWELPKLSPPGAPPGCLSRHLDPRLEPGWKEVRAGPLAGSSAPCAFSTGLSHPLLFLTFAVLFPLFSSPPADVHY